MAEQIVQLELKFDRRKRKGGPNGPKPVDPIVRFWAKVNKNGPIPEFKPELGNCYLWTGCKRNGYGRLFVRKGIGRGRLMGAHVFAYELEHGKVPAGLTLDHLCRVRACVRASHLEPVPGRVNVLRGVGITAENARKDHCPRGHAYDAVNTHLYRGRNGGLRRLCKICRKAQRRQAYLLTGK